MIHRTVLAAAIAAALGHAAPVADAARLDPRLVSKLAAAGAADRLEVIVTFPGEGAPSDADLAKLRALGLAGASLRTLPMAGVVATPEQVRALAADPAIRSVYWNRPLSYENEQATQISGVDRLRSDATLRTSRALPYTGSGVTVLVNDSGIDATHLDLQYG